MSMSMVTCVDVAEPEQNLYRNEDGGEGVEGEG
jgi:hypothetical protein